MFLAITPIERSLVSGIASEFSLILALQSTPFIADTFGPRVVVSLIARVRSRGNLFQSNAGDLAADRIIGVSVIARSRSARRELTVLSFYWKL